MADIEADREQIRGILSDINRAWLDGNTDVLERHFHDDMVIAQPGFGIMGEGRDACVDSYKDFADSASVSDLKESEHIVLVWGDTAVASYKFEIEFEMDGKARREAGYDLFVFARQAGRWLAVWRTVLPVQEA
jgi:ketosteroid isomerase-like protein